MIFSSIPKGFRSIVGVGVTLFCVSLIWQVSQIHKQRPAHESFHDTFLRNTVYNFDSSSNLNGQAMPGVTTSSALSVPTGEDLDLYAAGMINFREKYALQELPPIVMAWRRAKVDWHDLVRVNNSKWHSFEDAPAEHKLYDLVEKERTVTDFLTRYQASGLSSEYGLDHGPLAGHAGCDKLFDPCLAHGRVACAVDEFCQWDETSASCMLWSSVPGERVLNATTRCGGTPAIVGTDGRLKAGDPAQCLRFVTSKTVVLT